MTASKLHLKEPVARSLEYWASVRGGDYALYEAETALTYSEWNDYADLLADALAGRGLGLDDVIAVRCRNRIEWAVIALACAKLDARLLSLDPDLSSATLRERLIGAHVSAIIVGDCDPAAIAPALDGLPLRLRAAMDDASPGFFNFWDLFPPVAQPRFGRAQPTLISWTAGHTGEAAAVSIPRRLSAPASISPPPTPERGCSMITVPMHRAWGPVQFWAALGAGRAIALIRNFNPAEVVSAIERRSVTHWSGLPESFRDIAALPDRIVRAADTSCLQDLTVGGGVAPWPLKERIIDLFGPILSEAYGATETGVITRLPPERQSEKPGSCGRPIRGVVVEIRDAEGRRLPPNATGEIWARTPRSVACGLTGPSARRDEDGFVATADVGRLDDEGFLYITGRSPTDHHAG